MSSCRKAAPFLQDYLCLCTFPYLCQLQIGTCHGCLPSTSTRIESRAAAAAGFQHSLKVVQGGQQNLGTLFLGVVGETGRMGLQIDIFRSQFYEPNFCISSYLSSVAQLDPTLCDPMNWSQPASSVHEIFQARILGCPFLLLISRKALKFFMVMSAPHD